MKLKRGNRMSENKRKNIDEEIFSKIELEASETVKEFIAEDKLGYKYYLYQEMKKRFNEIGIDWEIPNNDAKAVIVDDISIE